MALLLTLIVSLAVLVTLLVDVSVEGWPVFATGRGLPHQQPLELGEGRSVAGPLGLSDPDRSSSWWSRSRSGMGAAVYLEEYARDTRCTRFINANIRNLAGVPAIVYGILGLVIFVQGPAGRSAGRGDGRYIAGGLTLAVLVLPIVIITTAEALRAVPNSIREAGYGVGRDAMGGHPEPRAAVGGARRSSPGPCSRWPAPSGRPPPPVLVGAVTGFFSHGDRKRLRERCGPVHIPADDHLRLVAAARGIRAGQHGRRHRRADGAHPRRERHRHHPAEPV